MSGGGAGEKDDEGSAPGEMDFGPLSGRVDLYSNLSKAEDKRQAHPEPSFVEQLERFYAYLQGLRRTARTSTPPRALRPIGLDELLEAVVGLGLSEEEARIAAISMGLRPPPRPQVERSRGPESRDRPTRPALLRPVEDRSPVEDRLSVEPAPEPLSPSPGAQLMLSQTRMDVRELPVFLRSVAALSEEAFRETSVCLRLPSLFEPAWVRGLVVTLLSTETRDGAVDISRLVALVSEGQAVTKLPQLARFSLRRGAQVLVDESEDMMPFSADAAQICGTIRALAAGAPVVIVRSERGCPELRRAAGEGVSMMGVSGAQGPSRVIHDDGEERVYRMPMRGVPIVAVTDLGLRSPDRAAEWLRFAIAVKRAGCPMIALTPYPKSRWPRAVAKRIAIVPWDRRTRVSAVRREARGAARSVS